VSYILSELAPYGSFANSTSIISQTKLDAKLVRTYFHELVAAVHYLHESGISHFGLSPSSVLIAKNFDLKLTNLSSALEDDEVAECDPRSSDFPDCWAPEMSHPSELEDPHKVDIYSMGVILFYLVFGEFPYPQKDEES
jgi:serine/threonine protein kinase